eukprot:7830978-Lingulodinium_polyedra.AAC.1
MHCQVQIERAFTQGALNIHTPPDACALRTINSARCQRMFAIANTSPYLCQAHRARARKSQDGQPI